MSDCNICHHRNDGRVMQRPVAGECERCHPVEEIADACVCAPLGEPRFLPVLAPVIFDECGINLCREIRIPEEITEDFPTVDAIELKVIDIDFNLDCPEGSQVDVISRRPNCVRVRLARICVKFAAKLLDARCQVLGERCFEVKFLPEECDPSFDEDLNPTAVIVELYAPYGVSYINVCGRCKPSINFLGFIEAPDRNNSIRQGIDCQCLAKVVDADFMMNRIAIGISIYLKSIYFVQYKLNHEGLCVPPKCVAIAQAESACREFVEGDLLEQSIQPLEVCVRPRSFGIGDSEPVTDPTPAQEPIEEDRKKRSGFRFT